MFSPLYFPRSWGKGKGNAAVNKRGKKEDLARNVSPLGFGAGEGRRHHSLSHPRFYIPRESERKRKFFSFFLFQREREVGGE